jgi:hypothetical protein
MATGLYIDASEQLQQTRWQNPGSQNYRADTDHKNVRTRRADHLMRILSRVEYKQVKYSKLPDIWHVK